LGITGIDACLSRFEAKQEVGLPIPVDVLDAAIERDAISLGW
jgi:hypothetical protein